MNIEYDDNKCVCCGKVHVNSLLMQVIGECREKFIICFDCANQIHNYVKMMKESKDA